MTAPTTTSNAGADASRETEHESVPEWAKVEAVKRLNEAAAGGHYKLPRDENSHSVLVAARLIAVHEEPPVDPLLIEARDIAASDYEARHPSASQWAGFCRDGWYDHDPEVVIALVALRRGIELAGETK